MDRAQAEVTKHIRAQHQQSGDILCCIRSLSCRGVYAKGSAPGLARHVGGPRQLCSGHRFYQLSWNYTGQLAWVHKGPELRLNFWVRNNPVRFIERGSIRDGCCLLTGECSALGTLTHNKTPAFYLPGLSGK